MKITAKSIMILMAAALLFGCSSNRGEKIRYDMEKLLMRADKISERINIQPQLATHADSLELRNAYEKVLTYFSDYRDDPLVTSDPEVKEQIDNMALTAQKGLALYYTGQRRADSALAAWRAIGKEIPADSFEVAGATLALALAYRSMNLLDSTMTIYDRLLELNYPPVDSAQRINTDLISIPIDKMRIANALNDKDLLNKVTNQAVTYYQRLLKDFPENPYITRTARVNMGRVYAMTKQWDKAIADLEQIKDSTGQVETSALVLIGNMYAGPLKEMEKATSLYRKILDRKPDSNVVGPVLLRLGTSLCAQRKYQEGRSVLAELKDKFSYVPTLVAQAQLFYARTFEAEQNWTRAQSEMEWLMEQYPYSDEAFFCATHIPRHYMSEGDTKLGEIWYKKAIDLYNRAIEIKAGQQEAVTASMYLSDLYRDLERWDEVLATLESIHAMVPGSKTDARALYNAATIAFTKLKDSTRAQGYLDQLNAEFGSTDSSVLNEAEPVPEFNIESLQ